MKKVILLVAILSAFAALTAFTTTPIDHTATETTITDFCDGWEDGYCEGWKDIKGQLALCPITPICPIPKIDETGYKSGYNRGFKAGMKAASR